MEFSNITNTEYTGFEKMIFDKYFEMGMRDFMKLRTCRTPWTKGAIAIDAYHRGVQTVQIFDEMSQWVDELEKDEDFWDNFWEDAE